MSVVFLARAKRTIPAWANDYLFNSWSRFSRLRRVSENHGMLPKPFKTKLKSTFWVQNDQKEGVPDFGKSWQIGPDRPRSADWSFLPGIGFLPGQKSPRSNADFPTEQKWVQVSRTGPARSAEKRPHRVDRHHYTAIPTGPGILSRTLVGQGAGAKSRFSGMWP